MPKLIAITKMYCSKDFRQKLQLGMSKTCGSKTAETLSRRPIIFSTAIFNILWLKALLIQEEQTKNMLSVLHLKMHRK